MLFVTESPVASGGRAMLSRRLFTPGGEHVATVMQEALFRPKPAEPRA
jgi:acyl-CoA thioesterase